MWGRIGPKLALRPSLLMAASEAVVSERPALLVSAGQEGLAPEAPEAPEAPAEAAAPAAVEAAAGSWESRPVASRQAVATAAAETARRSCRAQGSTLRPCRCSRPGACCPVAACVAARKSACLPFAAGRCPDDAGPCSPHSNGWRSGYSRRVRSPASAEEHWRRPARALRPNRCGGGCDPARAARPAGRASGGRRTSRRPL